MTYADFTDNQVSVSDNDKLAGGRDGWGPFDTLRRGFWSSWAPGKLWITSITAFQQLTDVQLSGEELKAVNVGSWITSSSTGIKARINRKIKAKMRHVNQTLSFSHPETLLSVPPSPHVLQDKEMNYIFGIFDFFVEKSTIDWFSVGWFLVDWISVLNN